MEKTKILLANYPKINQSATFAQIGGADKIEVITGYDIQVDSHQVTLDIARDMITALLTYDEVWLLGNNFTDVIQVFGIDYLKELLRLHLLKVIPDVSMNPVLIKEHGGVWKHSFFGYANACENYETGERVMFEGPVGNVENWLFKKGVASEERNAIAYLLEENKSNLDTSQLLSTIIAETDRDMKSMDFLTDNRFYRKNGDHYEYNQLSALRLHHLNALSVIAATLKMDGLKTDGAISQLLIKKSRSVLSAPLPDGVDALTHINQQKGFPDLGELFVNQIIGLDDVLQLRNSIQGRFFRYWAKYDEYEEEQMRRDVMNTVQFSLGGRISKAVRLLTCNLVGLTGFLPGIVASVADSYVMDAIGKGWHPNLFLDNQLKQLLDEKVANREEARRQAEIEARFRGVQRNDPCPCGSGKKFKNCHGKNC